MLYLSLCTVPALPESRRLVSPFLPYPRVRRGVNLKSLAKLIIYGETAKLLIEKGDLAAAGFHIAFLAYANAVFAVARCCSIEAELITLMSLSHIGDLKTFDLMFLIPSKIPEVKHMLDIFHGIHVSIDIYIIIISIDGTDEFRLIIHLYTTALIYRTFLIFLNPVVNRPIVDRKNIVSEIKEAIMEVKNNITKYKEVTKNYGKILKRFNIYNYTNNFEEYIEEITK